LAIVLWLCAPIWMSLSLCSLLSLSPSVVTLSLVCLSVSVFSPSLSSRCHTHAHTGHKRKSWHRVAPRQTGDNALPARTGSEVPGPSRAGPGRSFLPGSGRETTQKGQARAPSCRNSQRRIPAGAARSP
jgi:hypothetical protein